MSRDGISAIEAINPALHRAKRILFQPFRFGFWWRFAVLGFLTGEMSSGGGMPGGNFNYNFPSRSGNAPADFPFHLPPLQQILPWLILAAVVAVVLMILMMWIGSTLKFVLFESVISGQPRIREGWRRWNAFGNSLFVWRLGYMIVSLLIEAVLIGLPVLAAWRAGIFRAPGQHLLLLIFGGLAFALISVVVVLAVLAVWVLTKDFVVPIMAGEGLTPAQAWRRLWPMMEPNKGSYAGYLGMKIVLSIAAGIGMMIVYFIAVLIVAIPAVIIAVVVAVAIGSGHHLAWTAMTITLAVTLGLIVIALLVVLMAMVAVPVVVFFQGYAIHFFSTRYEPLYRMLFPQAPPEAPAPEPA